MISVLVVDDHRLVRKCLSRILDDNTEIDVVAEADSGEQAVRLARIHLPSIIFMDLDMPGMGGMEATRRLARICPACKVIVISAYATEPFPSRVLRAGAAGFISKASAVCEIFQAVSTVQTGQRYVSPDVARKMMSAVMPVHLQTPFKELSDRELQVMLMFIQGHKVMAISNMLCLSPKTVSTYRYRIFNKLKVSNCVELTRLAARHELLAAAGRVTGNS